MQKVKYVTFEEFLEDLSQNDRDIVLKLREIIYTTLPNVKEKFSYNVPYYYLKKNICFIWPGSVLWGNQRSYNGVRFGFSQGYLLEDPEGYLEHGNRKQVFTKDYLTASDIDVNRLKYFLNQARNLDK